MDPLSSKEAEFTWHFDTPVEPLAKDVEVSRWLRLEGHRRLLCGGEVPESLTSHLSRMASWHADAFDAVPIFTSQGLRRRFLRGTWKKNDYVDVMWNPVDGTWVSVHDCSFEQLDRQQRSHVVRVFLRRGLEQVLDYLESAITVPSQVRKGCVRVLELFSLPRVTPLLAQVNGCRSAALDLRTGWNIFNPQDRARALECIRREQPMWVLVTPVCTGFSQLFWAGASNTSNERFLEATNISLAILHFCILICIYQIRCQRYFLLEQPRGAKSMITELMTLLLSMAGVFVIDFDQCCTGLVVESDGLPAKKPTSIVTNSPDMVEQFLPLLCEGDHPHGKLQGRDARNAQEFTPTLCKIVARGIRRSFRRGARRRARREKGVFATTEAQEEDDDIPPLLGDSDGEEEQEQEHEEFATWYQSMRERVINLRLKDVDTFLQAPTFGDFSFKGVYANDDGDLDPEGIEADAEDAGPDFEEPESPERVQDDAEAGGEAAGGEVAGPAAPAVDLTNYEKKLVEKVHVGLGHPSNPVFLRTLRVARCRQDVLRYVKEIFRCDRCHLRQRAATPRKAAWPRTFEFNKIVGIDTVFLMVNGEPVPVLVCLCHGTGYMQAWIGIACNDYDIELLGPRGTDGSLPPAPQSQKDAWESFSDWIKYFGPPELVLSDNGPEFGETFSRFMELAGITHHICNGRSPWENGRTERNGGRGRL